MRKCSHCGRDASPDHRFCEYCGTNLKAGESSEKQITGGNISVDIQDSVVEDLSIGGHGHSEQSNVSEYDLSELINMYQKWNDINQDSITQLEGENTIIGNKSNVGEQIEKDSIISPIDARLFELDYIGRFNKSIRELSEIYLPNGEEYTVPEGYWEQNHESDSDRERIVDLLATYGLEKDSISCFPHCERVTYELRTSKLFVLKDQKLSIQAMIYADVESYLQSDREVSPAGRDDLLNVISKLLNESSNETHNLVAIASPTGWKDSVVELIKDEQFARFKFDSDLSVCLVDLRTDNLIYDETNEILERNIHIFCRSVDDEKVANCIRDIDERFISDPMREWIPLHEVAGSLDYDPSIIKAAFDRLDRELNEQTDVINHHTSGLTFACRWRI